MRRLLLAALALLAVAPAARAAEDPTALVNPFAGTAAGAHDFGTGGGAGNTFPGAATPFGMVQFSPDTLPGIEAFGGGYSYRDSHLAGFSLRHLSGPGCAVYQDVPLLPTTEPVDRSPHPRPTSTEMSLRPAIGREHAAPGDYRVRLGDGTDVELTA
ncbi:MAG TPA: hypothetical protein VHF89_14815, partial [Solirubrobacteraceae bacterium]|nr:hypothetical protein [Solirubrobacteraceae bacterium]